MHTSSNDPIVIGVGTEKVLWAEKEAAYTHLWGSGKSYRGLEDCAGLIRMGSI